MRSSSTSGKTSSLTVVVAMRPLTMMKTIMRFAATGIPREPGDSTVVHDRLPSCRPDAGTVPGPRPATDPASASRTLSIITVATRD